MSSRRRSRLQPAAGACVDATVDLLRLPGGGPARRAGGRARVHRARGGLRAAAVTAVPGVRAAAVDPGRRDGAGAAVAAVAAAAAWRCWCRAGARRGRWAGGARAAGCCTPGRHRGRDHRRSLPRDRLLAVDCWSFLGDLERRDRRSRTVSTRQSCPAFRTRRLVLGTVGTVGGLGALVWVAFKVGALSYGGGFVIIPLMQHDAVTTSTGCPRPLPQRVALGQITSRAGRRHGGRGRLPPRTGAGGVIASVVAFTPHLSR